MCKQAKMTTEQQQAFEAWWHEPHEFCRHPKIAYETGWQAAIEWYKLYVHDSLNKLRAYDIDPDRYIRGYNEALDDAIAAITEQP